jgi:hypothetical protein
MVLFFVDAVRQITTAARNRSSMNTNGKRCHAVGSGAIGIVIG